MRALLIAAGLALAALSAHADYVAKRGDNMVRITDADCPADILAMIPEPERMLYAKAFAVIDGKQYRACWRIAPEMGGVYIRYEDGDQGAVPFGDLVEDPGV